jgi:hypothetical protein
MWNFNLGREEGVGEIVARLGRRKVPVGGILAGEE